MTDYTDLIKRAREEAEGPWKEDCVYVYDGDDMSEIARLILDLADALEQLQKDNESLQESVRFLQDRYAPGME